MEKPIEEGTDKDGESDNRLKSVSLEDALELAKFGKFNYLLITIAGMILAAVMLETLSISYVIAVADCELGMTTQQKGILGAVALVGIMVSSHLWGFLADTLGRRKVILPTLLSSCAVSFISSFVTNFWLLTVCRFVVGFLVCGASATVYAYLGEFNSGKDRSRAIMAAALVHSIACPLLPGLAFLVINQSWQFTIPLLDAVYRPWRLFIVICGLPGLISAFALIPFPESPKFTLNQGRTKETLETIQWMHRVNSGGTEEPLRIRLIPDENERKIAVTSEGSPKGIQAVLSLIWNQTAPLFQRQYLRSTFLVCFLQFGTYVTAHGMFMFFPGLLDKLVKTQEAGVERIALCDIVYEYNNSTVPDIDGSSECTPLVLSMATYGYSFILDLIYILGFLIMGVIVNTVGRLSILVFVFAGCGMCGLLAILVDVPMVAMWAYIMMMMSGFSVSIVSAVAVDLFPTSLRAMAIGISLMCGRLGGIFGTNIAGILLDSQCELTFGLASGILLLCSVLSFLIPNIFKKI